MADSLFPAFLSRSVESIRYGMFFPLSQKEQVMNENSSDELKRAARRLEYPNIGSVSPVFRPKTAFLGAALSRRRD
jgi:hypothetical protein